MGSFISTTQDQHHHCPTPEDVYAVRSFLLAFVPAELANMILNEANYWPKATLTFEPEDPLEVIASRNQLNNAHACCFVTSKLCDLLYGGKKDDDGDDDDDRSCSIKTISFKIVSHDQGWCSQSFSGKEYIYMNPSGCGPIFLIIKCLSEDSGRYEGSYTWFEAIIVRDFNHVLTSSSSLGPGSSHNLANLETERIHQALNEKYPNPNVVTVKTPDDENSDTWNIQRNERANGEFQLHTVVWTEEEEEKEEEAVDESILMNETGRGLGRGFVRSLMKEDRIAVMARAQVSLAFFVFV